MKNELYKALINPFEKGLNVTRPQGRDNDLDCGFDFHNNDIGNNKDKNTYTFFH